MTHPVTYTIVKHAGVWEELFLENPLQGVHMSHSCHTTYTAKILDIKEQYDSVEEAEKDCTILNKTNPSGYYGVCPVLK